MCPMAWAARCNRSLTRLLATSHARTCQTDPPSHIKSIDPNDPDFLKTKVRAAYLSLCRLKRRLGRVA